MDKEKGIAYGIHVCLLLIHYVVPIASLLYNTTPLILLAHPFRVMVWYDVAPLGPPTTYKAC